MGAGHFDFGRLIWHVQSNGQTGACRDCRRMQVHWHMACTNECGAAGTYSPDWTKSLDAGAGRASWLVEWRAVRAVVSVRAGPVHVTLSMVHPPLSTRRRCTSHSSTDSRKHGLKVYPLASLAAIVPVSRPALAHVLIVPCFFSASSDSNAFVVRSRNRTGTRNLDREAQN